MLEFAGFRLQSGQYEAIAPDTQGKLSCTELQLALGIHNRQLRWFTAQGDLMPLLEERERQEKEQERQARFQAEQQAAQERQARERLASYLRSQGIDPDRLPERMSEKS